MTRQPAPSPTLLQTLLRLTVLVFVVSSVVVGIALVASRVVKNNVLLTYVYSPTARVPGQFIQLIDLQRNQTQSVMYGVAEKYVPSPNQRYIIYESNRYEGKYCEVRDVHNGLRLIYRTEYVLRCRPMWSNDSRTVVLLTLLLDASFHIILVPIASPQQAQVIYNSEGTWYWYISTLSSDNRMLLFLQDASNGDWKVLFIDTSTGTTQVFQQLGSFYENSYLSQEVRVDWSPNGRYAAFSSTKRRKSQLLLLDTYQGTVRSIDWGGAYVYKVEWSFDSSGFLFHAPSLEHTFLSAGSWSVFHYNITTMVVDTLSPQAATWLQIEWSPAGRYIVASTSPPSGQVRSPFNLYLWDTVRDSQVTLTQNADTYLDYTWSPDGRYLAWTYEKDEIFEYRLLDVSLGTQHLLLATQNFRSGLYWIDSNQLMIGVQNETDHFIYIVDVLTGEMRRSGSLRNISSWSLSPDNRYLIAVNSSLQSRGNDLLDLFTLEATLLSEHPGNEVERAWSPDGERYVFVGEDDGYDLYIVDLPCLCVRRVTQTFLEEAVPLWVR